MLLPPLPLRGEGWGEGQQVRRANGSQLLKPSLTPALSGLFQFSKVAPIRSIISNVQERLRAVEKELATLKCGKEPPHSSV